jgi:hypothetical protein
MEGRGSVEDERGGIDCHEWENLVEKDTQKDPWVNGTDVWKNMYEL